MHGDGAPAATPGTCYPQDPNPTSPKPNPAATPELCEVQCYNFSSDRNKFLL